MAEPTNGELALMIKGLTDTTKLGFERVDEQFKAVHDRQDYTNGKVAKSEEFRLQNEEFLKELKKDKRDLLRRATDVVWKLGTAALLGAMGYSHFLK